LTSAAIEPHVLVVATNEAMAATIEGRLRRHGGWRVAVGTPSHAARLLDRHRSDAVVLAIDRARVRRALELLRSHPAVPPIMLLLDDPRGAWTREARRGGVRSVMPADATPEQLTAALRGIAQGLVVLHPDCFDAGSTVAPRAAHDNPDLTPREVEIVDMMAEGLSNHVIARRLGISRHTVKFHVASILAKLRASSRTEAVMIAVKRGLVVV
jgi:two-component system, NarL family, response regulator YdfI